MKTKLLLISLAALLNGVQASGSAAGAGDGKKPFPKLSITTDAQAEAIPVTVVAAQDQPNGGAAQAAAAAGVGAAQEGAQAVANLRSEMEKIFRALALMTHATGESIREMVLIDGRKFQLLISEMPVDPDLKKCSVGVSIPGYYLLQACECGEHQRLIPTMDPNTGFRVDSKTPKHYKSGLCTEGCKHFFATL